MTMLRVSDKVVMVNQPNKNYPENGTLGIVEGFDYPYVCVAWGTGGDGVLLMDPNEIELVKDTKTKCENCQCDGPCGPTKEEEPVEDAFHFSFGDGNINHSINVLMHSRFYTREDIREKFEIFLDAVFRLR